MKRDRIIKFICLLAGLTLFHSISSAQTIVTTSYTNTFDTGGETTFFSGSGSVASWLYWYGQITGAMTNDPTMDAQGDTNTSGSLYCSLPFTNIDEQEQMFGTFDNLYGYDNAQQIPLNIITNIAFDIHVQPGTQTNSSGNFGQITMSLVDPGWQNGGRVGTWTPITIPAEATNGWVHLEDTNLVADLASMVLSEAGETTVYTNAAGVGFYVQSYGGYPTNIFTFWIDNVAVTTASAPPPPPPPPSVKIFSAVPGLTLFTGSGTSLYNRESLEADQNNYSWVGASGPVSYSFTIASYPIGPNDQVQNHIFLIPNPGTESAPDYSEPNLIFFDLESTTTGAPVWMFRYKTNELNGNSMVYGVGTLATVTNTGGALGTWTATFNNNTNVTMTTPNGTTTNFSIPDTTGATTALFASGVALYYGAQAGNAGGVEDHLVASDFSVTGLGSSVDFNDNFATDDGSLNTSIWMVNAAFPNCVQLVAPSDPLWIQWTSPATGFTLESTPTLSTNITWTPTTSFTSFLAGTNYVQLVSTNDLPAGSTGFFNLVQP